jgi:L-2-hydroxycarboxylate dehydrogenase (NAD+)
MKVQAKNLHQFMIEVLQKVDVPHSDAVIMADILIESDLRGIDSHGINRLKPIYVDRIKDGIVQPVTQYKLIKETPTTAVIDGQNGMGMVISYHAMKMAIKKAKTYGMSMIAVRNSSHYGIAGYYASMATDSGLIAFTGTNARPSIAPTHGVENMLGTNPLTVGLPTDEPYPFILDAATSISQRGKIELYERKGIDTPEGLVIGRDGSYMTDSSEILKALVNGDAALSPLGGKTETLGSHKGYGYATIVEILSSALQMGNYMKMLTGLNEEGEKVPYNLGHFFLCIDPNAFLGLDSFKKTTGNILRELRNSKKSPGESRIYTAFEKEYETKLNRSKEGIELNPSLLKDIEALEKAYDIELIRE